MANSDMAALDSSVTAYIKDWQTSLQGDIRETRMGLMRCKPDERGPLETRLQTLDAVSERLGGYPAETDGTAQLRREITVLKLQLEEAEADRKKLEDRLSASVKTNEDVKIKFQQSYAEMLEDMMTQEHNYQLKGALNSALASGLKSAIDVDRRHKLEEASMQLEPRGQGSTEAPLDLSELVIRLEKSTRDLEQHVSSRQRGEQQRDQAAETKETKETKEMKETLQAAETETKETEEMKETLQAAETKTKETEETLQAVRTCMNVCVETFGVLRSRMEKLESGLQVKDAQPSGLEDDRVISIRIGDFQTVVGEALTELSAAYQPLLESRTTETANLQATDKMTRVLQRVRRINLGLIVQNKLSRHKERDSKPKRRNWLQRLFSCFSGQDIEQ